MKSSAATFVSLAAILAAINSAESKEIKIQNEGSTSESTETSFDASEIRTDIVTRVGFTEVEFRE
jgi:hypothetical protein